MNGKRAKQLRKENEVIVVLDKDVALWLQGFFTVLLAPLKMDDLTTESISARQTLRAIQEGLKDGNTDSTSE